MARKNSKQSKAVKKPSRPRRTKAITRKKSINPRRRIEIYAIFIIMTAVLMGISVFLPQDTGYVNQRLNEFLSYIFGIGKYIFPFLLLDRWFHNVDKIFANEYRIEPLFS